MGGARLMREELVVVTVEYRLASSEIAKINCSLWQDWSARIPL